MYIKQNEYFKENSTEDAVAVPTNENGEELLDACENGVKSDGELIDLMYDLFF